MAHGTLEASVADEECGPVIVLTGEADMTCEGQLSELLTGRLAAGTRHLTIEVSGLRFADAASIRMVVLTAKALKERDGSLTLLHPRRLVARVLALLDADQMITIVGGSQATSRSRHGTKGNPELARIRHRDQEGAQMRKESAGWQGRLHEVGFYRSDAEFGALIVPFVEEGVAAGQPVIIGYDDRKASLLRSWLSNPAAVTFIADSSLYATPARAIDSYRRMFKDLTAAGATQIRIAGDVPHEGNGSRFAGWDRYESAVNTVWDQFPVWSRCLYDGTTAAPRVLDIAARTHPRIVMPSGQYEISRRYQDAAHFQPLTPDADPLERSAPAIELSDPSIAQVRHAVTSIGAGQVPVTALEDLEIGAAEAVGNAWLRGRPPVTARIWAASGRLLVHIHDTGPGPGDSLAGLVPAWAGPGLEGAGLWLIHMLDLDTSMIRSRDGFTIRLAAGHAA